MSGANALSTNVGEPLPAWMGEYAEEAKREADEINERITPILHLCQPQSPEVMTGKAKMGDYMVRPIGTPLGGEFHGVVLATMTEWVKWKSRDSGGGIIWRYPEGEVPEAHQADCLWTDKGDKRIPPAAKETRNFIVVSYDPVQGVLDPAGCGPFMLSLSSMSAKAGVNLNVNLKVFMKRGSPIFGLVLKFGHEQQSNEHGTFQVTTVEPVGRVESKDVGKQLAELKKLFATKTATPEEAAA